MVMSWRLLRITRGVFIVKESLSVLIVICLPYNLSLRTIYSDPDSIDCFTSTARTCTGVLGRLLVEAPPVLQGCNRYAIGNLYPVRSVHRQASTINRVGAVGDRLHTPPRSTVYAPLRHSTDGLKRLSTGYE